MVFWLIFLVFFHKRIRGAQPSPPFFFSVVLMFVLFFLVLGQSRAVAILFLFSTALQQPAP